MKAEKNKVVTFHYHLTDESGTKVDSSHDRPEPLTVLFGHGQIIPGLEQAMEGREAGDKFVVNVPPEQGYGERREGFNQRVPKKYFRDAEHLKPGDATVLSVQGGGYRQVVVLKVGSSVIDVDLNHPMAGKTLSFDVEITNVREATPEEVEHGHVHGEGGHHH
ncbi:MAG: peptidylprolyl isomerase [Rudaea sp.]|uniref:FKBP-type peptidyl-prolyl cis-trans isomerase n=1 Tax=Rudaea sp. TaxID=2136325 RepID=UPI0039E541AF